MIVSSALMVWKGLFVLSGTGSFYFRISQLVLDCSESPIVVVLSGSMEPAFYRGDLLFLYHDREVNFFLHNKIYCI
jgi:signal peptidase I